MITIQSVPSLLGLGVVKVSANSSIVHSSGDGRMITAVTSDSRQLCRDCIFVAIKGTQQDGHSFIAQAAEASALLIVGELPEQQIQSQLRGVTNYLQVADSRKALGILASEFYGNPSRSMLMVGVTGTSGKTTSTYLLESVLKAAGHQVGVVGTVNFRYGTKIYPSTHTTPGAPELNQLLAEMRADGCTAVVMEVSSHALKQHRTAGLAFDAMLFTNLSREHLDFHPDMEDYYRSKAMLFTDYVDAAIAVGKNPKAVVNLDDEYGKRLYKELTVRKTADHVSAFSLKSPELQSPLQVGLAGVQGQYGDVRIDSPLFGMFNASNVLGAVAIGRALKIPADQITKGITACRDVPGRMERVPNTRGVHVVVDYAHKPDALQKVLETLSAIKGAHKVITVFGCGGDRDKTKRPVMGGIAKNLSDIVVVTSDNPRTEDPLTIIKEITQGIATGPQFLIEPDRRSAIALAIKNAKAGDIVLIAGKGHEDYQIVGTQKLSFDDRLIAAELLNNA